MKIDVKEDRKEIEKDIAEYGEESVYVQCEIYGNFVEDRDRYFKAEEIDFCIEKYNVPEDKLPRCNYYLGNDIAGEGEDESVFITILLYGEVMRVTAIDYFDKNKPRELVVMLQDLDNKYNFERLYIDKTGLGEGPADWIGMEIGEHKVEDIRFSIVSKMDMYSNLKMWIQKREMRMVGGEMTEVPAIMLPDNKLLLKEMMELRYERMPNKTIKIYHPDGDKYHDDFVDALALACLWLKEEEVTEYDALFGEVKSIDL